METLVPGGEGRGRVEKKDLKQWILNGILLKKIFFPNLSLSNTETTCPNMSAGHSQIAAITTDVTSFMSGEFESCGESFYGSQNTGPLCWFLCVSESPFCWETGRTLKWAPNVTLVT